MRTGAVGEFARGEQAARAEVRTARLLVTAQFALLGVLVLLRGRQDWPVPRWLSIACTIGAVLGLGIVVLGGTALGRGLTATPLPNQHAQLRTRGLYGFVRHPIYTGLLLTAGSITVASGSVFRLVVFLLLAGLLAAKARWEETRLVRRFDGYRAYASGVPRFLPRRARR